MIWEPMGRTRIFVVDSYSRDYSSLLSASQRGLVELTFFTTGRDALRANCSDSPAMWIINMHLSDMEGTDLQGLLRSQGCEASVALVGDKYNEQDELVARCNGADMYFAKPLDTDLVLAANCQ